MIWSWHFDLLHCLTSSRSPRGSANLPFWLPKVWWSRWRQLFAAVAQSIKSSLPRQSIAKLESPNNSSKPSVFWVQNGLITSLFSISKSNQEEIKSTSGSSRRNQRINSAPRYQGVCYDTCMVPQGFAKSSVQKSFSASIDICWLWDTIRNKIMQQNKAKETRVTRLGLMTMAAIKS